MGVGGGGGVKKGVGSRRLFGQTGLSEQPQCIKTIYIYMDIIYTLY